LISIARLRLPRGFALLLLAALVARALVPVGFMPSAERSGALKFCHAGMMVPDEGSPGEGHSSGHVDHCPFGSAPATGPLSAGSVPAIRPVLADIVDAAPLFDLPGRRPARAHRSRGPPQPA
jgi:hypothetical protein